jgi:carboxylesterase
MMSPTFEYDGWSLSHWTKWRKLAYFLHVDQFISIREREPFGIKNPKIRKWIARDMQQRHASAVGPSKLPLRALREGERLMAQVAHALPQISCPTLIMHAREDEITSLASVQRLCEKLPTKQRELIVLEESYHMITIDNDRGKVADELTCFMKKFGETSSRPLEFLRTTSKPQPQNHGVIPIAVAA